MMYNTAAKVLALKQFFFQIQTSMTLCTGYETFLVGGKATHIPFNGKICSVRLLTLQSESCK